MPAKESTLLIQDHVAHESPSRSPWSGLEGVAACIRDFALNLCSRLTTRTREIFCWLKSLLLQEGNCKGCRLGGVNVFQASSPTAMYS